MRLLIRTDASGTIGGGHAMRCLALAEAALERGHLASLIMAEGVDMIRARASRAGVAVESIDTPPGSSDDAAFTAGRAADILLVDTPRASSSDFLGRVAISRPLVLLDDMGREERLPADLIVNQNAHAGVALYPGMPPDKLLLGPDYALLSRPIRALVPRPPAPTATRLLLTLGAGDAGGLLTQLAAGLAAGLAGLLEIDVVVGPSSRETPSGDRLRLHWAPSDLGPLLASADLVVSAGGSTLWEVCYLGIPAFVIVLADNQQGNARVLDRLGAAVSVGPASSLDIADLATHIKSLALDPNRRQTISRKARGLVDGRGVSRVLDALDGLIASEAAKPRCSSER